MGKAKFGAGVVLGALLGGVAAFFLSPKSGKENRDAAKRSFITLKKKYEGKSPDEIAKEIFGQASTEGKKLYSKAQKELNSKLDDLQKSAKEIDYKKYQKVVDDVMGRLMTEKDATKDRVAKLQKYLMGRWEYVQTKAEEDAKEVVEKAVKKAK